MEIFVDADACPVVKQVEEIAKKYKIATTLLCDTSHVLKSEYSSVKIVDAGADSVDIVLVNHCRRGDIVVTQDYGVAAMALGKGAFAIHQSGLWFTNENIDSMLYTRHIAKVARNSRQKTHLKGPKKRTPEDNRKFVESFEKLVCKVLSENA